VVNRRIPLSFTPTLSGDSDVSIYSPSTNQVLMYNGSKWANNTMTLEQNSDVVVSSLINKNILRWNGTNWVNVADLTNDETNIATLQVSTGILVNTTNTAQNTTIVTAFSDSSSGNPIIHGNATSPSIITPTAAYLYPVDNITIYSYYVNDGGHTDANFTNTSMYRRYNINYGALYQFYSFNWSLSSVNNTSNFVFNVYGGTLASCYTDTANDTTNLTLLCTPSLSVTTGSTSITNTSSFQYIVLISYPLSNSSCGYSTNNNNGFYCYKTAGGYSNLVLNSDWSVATDSSTGFPAITYLDSGSNNLTYNLNNLMLEEMYRRIYPTVHDTNNLFLGSTSGWNISNSSGTLNFNYNSTNEMSLSSGGNLTINGTLPTINKLSNVSISSPTTNQVLQFNGTNRINATISTGAPTSLTTSTSTIAINSTTPSPNQALTATSSTVATWQTISHLNLSNIGNNTHAQIDTSLSQIATSMTNFNMSTGIVKTSNLHHKIQQ